MQLSAYARAVRRRYRRASRSAGTRGSGGSRRESPSSSSSADRSPRALTGLSSNSVGSRSRVAERREEARHSVSATTITARPKAMAIDAATSWKKVPMGCEFLGVPQLPFCSRKRGSADVGPHGEDPSRSGIYKRGAVILYSKMTEVC
jgi:hypothetical protein